MARAAVELGENLDSVRDRAELFETAAKTPTTSLGSYLRARALVDEGKTRRRARSSPISSPPTRSTPASIRSPRTGSTSTASPPGALGRTREAANLFEGAASLKTPAARPRSSWSRGPFSAPEAWRHRQRTDARPNDATWSRAKKALDAWKGVSEGRFAWSSVGWRGRSIT